MLEGRTAIISGIGPGMGRSLALAMAGAGADVVLAARSKDKLDAVADEVTALGRRATCVPTDVTDPDSVAALADAAADAHGQIDILVNNAFQQPPMDLITDATLDTWRKSLEVNLLGAVSVTNAVAPHMRGAGGGSIVFISTMSSRRVKARFAVYSATKAALNTTMQHYANELGRDGIRVNSVVPGYIWGPNLEAWFAWQAQQRDVDPQVIYDEVAQDETALHRLPTSDEVAQAALFLASDMASAITGAAIDVNAGNWFH